MMAKEHVTTRTQVNVQQMATAFYDAYSRFLNSCPKPESVKILLSHWALETGWGKAMRCYNVGNAKSRDGDGYDYCYFACNEILTRASAERFHAHAPNTTKITKYRSDDRCVIWFYPRHRWSRFRAFDNLYEGAYDHLKLLIRRFGLAWQPLVNGNVEAYSRMLKAQRYYTADEPVYTKTIKAVFSMFEDIELPEQPMFTEREREQVLNNVALSLARLRIQQK